MELEDFEKHRNFLLKYAVDNNILFRVSRNSVSVGVMNRPERKKKK